MGDTAAFSIGVRGDWENNLAASGGGAWDREDFLVHARLILAVACTITVCLNRASFARDRDASQLLVLVYLTYSVISLIIARLHRHYGLAWGVCLQGLEVVITSLIMLSSGGAQSPFLGLYLFVVLAAAFKWGFNGALLTACACIAFLFSDLILPSSWSTKSPNLMGEGSSFVTTMTLSATLVSLACLLGLLVEREMKRYGDATVITALLRSAVPEPSFRAALSNTLLSVREHFDADQVRLALQEINGDEGIAWEVTRLTKSKENGLHSWKLTESLRQGCFAMPPEKVRHALGLGRTGGGTSFREGAEGYKRRGALGRWVHGAARLFDRTTEW